MAYFESTESEVALEISNNREILHALTLMNTIY